MVIDLYALLSENVMLLVFLVLAIGFTLGKIKIAGINAGSTIGVLLAGLVFGHFGFKIDPLIGSIGFSLFIFSVGLQAGALTSTPSLAGAQDAYLGTCGTRRSVSNRPSRT